MDKAFLLLARDFSPHSDEVIQLLVTPFSPLKSKGKLITFESSNPYKTNYSMDVFTLGEYAIKAAIEVGRKIKTLNTTEVDSGIAEAYKRALSDWSQHAPTSSDELRLNTALDGHIKNATSYEALDQDTKDFIDRFKKRLSEQPAAHNYLMTLRADEQANSEEQNLQEHRKTQESILDLKGRMEELNMAPQYVRALLKELPLEQGLERTESTLEEMLTNGRIHSEGAKCLIAEFVRFLFERTDKITEEAKRLRKAGDSYLAETLEEIKKVLTGESEQSLTAIYEKFKEQERQNEVKALEELIEAAQIQFSFGEARTFYEKLIKLAPTVEHHFNYAYLLQSLNDFDRARSQYDKTLQELRVLSKQNPEAYKPNLADTLNNLGNLLHATNELEQAQSYYEEALKIRREFAELNPEAYKPSLAGTLNNLGNLLRTTNELRQAQSYYEEALLIHRELSELNPEAYKPNLAGTLNNLGNLLCATNELKEAQSYYEEALRIRRELTEFNPEAYKPDLASILNNLGNLLRATNVLEQAQSYYEEALQIHQELAEFNPETYKPDLAGTLNNFGNLLYATNEVEQAQSYYKEALLIYRELTELNPEAYKPDLARTLNNLGNLLRATNELEQAQSYYEEALKIRRELAELDPKAYKPDLARALNNLGNLLRATNVLEQAQSYYEEALQIRRELAELNPEAYKPNLAGTLSNLGDLLTHTNELKQAQSYYKEALQIRRELAKLNPKAYKPDLASTLKNLTIFYLQLGEKEEAESAYQEAYTIYQELANRHPKAYEIDYAKTLITGVIMLGRPLERLGEAKAILSKYPEHPEIQELLSFIEGLSKKEQ